ncbi:MAG: conjugal transfer protein TraH [Rectinema sp.]|nr:conjugal transfer protein TraH [Rectinema sp.]
MQSVTGNSVRRLLAVCSCSIMLAFLMTAWTAVWAADNGNNDNNSEPPNSYQYSAGDAEGAFRALQQHRNNKVSDEIEPPDDRRQTTASEGTRLFTGLMTSLRGLDATSGTVTVTGTGKTNEEEARNEIQSINNEAQQKLNQLSDALDDFMGRFAGESLRRNMIAQHGKDMATDQAKSERQIAEPAIYGSFWPIVRLHKDVYGIHGSFYVDPKPTNLRPTISLGPLQNMASDINSKIQRQVDEAKDKFTQIANEVGLGGCGEFEMFAEFQALFQEDVLEDFLENLGEGVLAAAPMAILTAMSPEIANIIQHLKAMAGMALQIAKGDCSMIQGILTDELTKWFNGKEWEECMTNARSAGLSQNQANANCRNRRAIMNAPFGLNAIAQAGVAIDNWINDAGTAISNGISYDEARKLREQAEKNVDMVVTNVTNIRNQMRDELRDASGDLQEYSRSCAEGNASDCKKVAEITQKMNNIRESYQREVAMMQQTLNYLPKTAGECLSNPECRGVAGVRDPTESDTSWTSRLARWYNDLVESNPVVGFLHRYLTQTVGPLHLNIGLEMGPYTFRYELQRRSHYTIVLADEIEELLPELWERYQRCDKSGFDVALNKVKLLWYGLYDNPWRGGRNNAKNILFQNRATDPVFDGSPELGMNLFGPYQLHPLAEFSTETILKLASIGYRIRHSTGLKRWIYLDSYLSSIDIFASEEEKKQSWLSKAREVDTIEPGYYATIQYLTQAALAYFTLTQLENDMTLEEKIREVQNFVAREARAEPTVQQKIIAQQRELFKRLASMTANLLQEIATAIPYIIATNAVPLLGSPTCLRIEDSSSIQFTPAPYLFRPPRAPMRERNEH